MSEMTLLRQKLLRLVKAVPQEVYRNVYARMVEAEQENPTKNTMNAETITRVVIYNDMQSLYDKFMNATGHDEEVFGESLYAYLMDLRPQSIPFKDFRVSLGTEGGTYILRETSFRTKKYQSDAEAVLAVVLNNFVEDLFPSSTVRMKNVREYTVSDDFKGEVVASAPLDILHTYLSFVSQLSPLLPPINFTKEQYGKKIIDEIVSFLIQKYSLSESVAEKFTSLVRSQYISHASVPFWDRNPQTGNAKYNGTHVKSFDFSKASTLVIPLYDCVQFVMSCSPHYQDELKSKTQLVTSHHGLSRADFRHFWDLGSLYFHTRQLRNLSVNQENTTSKYKNLEESFLSETFELEAASAIQNELRAKR